MQQSQGIVGAQVVGQGGQATGDRPPGGGEHTAALGDLRTGTMGREQQQVVVLPQDRRTVAEGIVGQVMPVGQRTGLVQAVDS